MRLFFVFIISLNLCMTSQSSVCFTNSGTAFCNSLNLTFFPQQINEGKLRVVDLSDNSLSGIGIYDLRNSRPLLEQLNLQNNHIEVITPQSFQHMTQLNELDLSWNAIVTSVSNRIFADNVNLDYLSLAHNKIECVEENAFKNINKLTELDISNNRLTFNCFEQSAVCQLTNLIVLKISSNNLPEVFTDSRVHDITKGFLSCLSKLTNLQASNCGIENISRNAFSGLNNIISIDLSENSITTWHSRLLRDLTALVYLDLSQNFLQYLPSDFLEDCPNLKHLSLRNNELKTIDYRWFSAIQANFKVTSFPIMTWLDWSGNPWLCDCDVIEFVDWIANEGQWLSGIFGYHDVICYDPTFHRGRTLLDVYTTGQVNDDVTMEIRGRCETTTPSVQTSTFQPSVSNGRVHSPQPVTENATVQTYNSTTRKIENFYGNFTSGSPQNTTQNTTPVMQFQQLMGGTVITPAPNIDISNITTVDIGKEPSRRSYTVAILACLLIDVIVVIVIFAGVKKYCLRKTEGRWATVVPINDIEVGN